jgi:HEAT repeat protein
MTTVLFRSSLLVIAALAPLAIAQEPPVPPAAPITPVAPVAPVAPIGPVAPAPPVPPAVLEDLAIVDLEAAIERAQEALHEAEPHLADLDMHLARKLSHPSFHGPDAPMLAGQIDKLARQMAFLAQPPPAQPPQPPQPPRKFEYGRYNPERNSEESLYRAGTRHLDRREYEPAIAAFDAAASKKGSKADGAHYWKAYALAKLGRRDEALNVLAELQKSYANSRWLDDAKALGVEIRQASGQALSPESQSDEDVKLMAINALMQSDPERVVPLLEKILSRGGSPKLKEQALFVLAQSRTPQARDLVVQFAKGKGNPDIQYKAVEYLGIHGGANTVQLLAEIYGSTNDANLKRRILHSFMTAGDRERLFNVAKTEPDVNLRREAIQLLGASKGLQELGQLYTTETNTEVREAIMQGLFVGGAHDKIMELARSEKEPKLRRQAIHRLGAMGRSPQAAEALSAMYASETDNKVKREILHALFMQGNVSRIIEIARKETDPELRREAVQRLSMSKSKEATDFLVELLNK